MELVTALIQPFHTKKESERKEFEDYYPIQTDTSMERLTFAELYCCTKVYPRLRIGKRSNLSS